MCHLCGIDASRSPHPTSCMYFAVERYPPYCIDLATLFHKFYNACRVNCDDKDLSAARIYLCLCVKEVLKNILTLLKISVPERM